MFFEPLRSILKVVSCGSLFTFQALYIFLLKGYNKNAITGLLAFSCEIASGCS